MKKLLISESIFQLIEGIVNINYSELNPNIKKIKANFGEIIYNYITDNGVEVSINPNPDVCYYNRQQVDGDFGIETIASSNRGSGLASKELQKILAFADKHDYSISLTVDSEGATTNAMGEKIDEVGLSNEQLKQWYSRHGFLFDKNSSCGFRPKKSELHLYKPPSTIQIPISEIDVDKIESISDPDTLDYLFSYGKLEEGVIYENGDGDLYILKNGELLEITNVFIEWDYNKGTYILKKK